MARENEESSAGDRNSIYSAKHHVLPEGSMDPVYRAKAELLNEKIQEIGMGKYQVCICSIFGLVDSGLCVCLAQWHLFIVTGFGWLADNLWPIVTGLILAPVVKEFGAKGPFLKLSQNIGLLVGALLWGIGSDIWGRK
jgi:hypothetical protein